MTQQALNLTITEWWFVAAITAAFAYFIAKRGLTTALYTLAGAVCGLLLADRIAKGLEPWVNFAYRAFLAVFREKAFSPEEMVKVMVKQPLLITQASQRIIAGSVVFVLILVLAYVIGKQRTGKPKVVPPTDRILATLAGAVTGYLTVYFLFPRHMTAAKTVITVPNVNVRDLLRVQLNLPILIMILVVITVGVLDAREGRTKNK
jgi:hypothetical protein